MTWTMMIGTLDINPEADNGQLAGQALMKLLPTMVGTYEKMTGTEGERRGEIGCDGGQRERGRERERESAREIERELETLGSDGVLGLVQCTAWECLPPLCL